MTPPPWAPCPPAPLLHFKVLSGGNDEIRTEWQTADRDIYTTANTTLCKHPLISLQPAAFCSSSCFLFWEFMSLVPELKNMWWTAGSTLTLLRHRDEEKPSMMGNKLLRYQCSTQERTTATECELHTNTHWQRETHTAAVTLQDAVNQSLDWSHCEEASRGHNEPLNVRPLLLLSTAEYYWELLSTTEYYWRLPSTTVHYWLLLLLLSTTEYYWVLPSSTTGGPVQLSSH